MSARITFNLAANGEFEIWLNEQGRDLLVRELQQLGEKNDHFHLGPADIGEVEVSSRPTGPTIEFLNMAGSFQNRCVGQTILPSRSR
jgi:hypothetical protein